MREQAKEEAARLRFADAAALYQQAAALLPTEDRDERGSDLVSTGLSWTDQGRDFGDNAALLSATAAFSAALGERTRERVPLDWAVTQNNLGAALATLGEREGETARLDKAVAAYRAALQEMTRERVPLDWSYSRHGLGNALARRARSVPRMEEAIDCMRGAAQEYDRNEKR